MGEQNLDRGREGFWPPLPPNRTGGFPAYGLYGAFIVKGASRHFGRPLHSILLFDPRREHSSVPTAYFHRRRAQRRSRTPLLQRRRRLVWGLYGAFFVKGASRHFLSCFVIPFFCSTRAASILPSRPHISIAVVRSGGQGRRVFSASDGLYGACMGLSSSRVHHAIFCRALSFHSFVRPAPRA